MAAAIPLNTYYYVVRWAVKFCQVNFNSRDRDSIRWRGEALSLLFCRTRPAKEIILKSPIGVYIQEVYNLSSISHHNSIILGNIVPRSGSYIKTWGRGGVQRVKIRL